MQLASDPSADTVGTLTGRRPLFVRLVFPLALLMAATTGCLVFTQRMAEQFYFTKMLGPPWLLPIPEPLVIVDLVVIVGLALYLCRFVPYLPVFATVPPVIALLNLASQPLYPPLAGFSWAGAVIRTEAGREAVANAALPALMAFVAVAGVGFALHKRLQSRYHPSRIAHGSARYAEWDDLVQEGLVGKGGIFLGAFRHGWRLHTLTDNSQHHTLFVMPSGAGKSAGHIIPSLLTRTHSAFVLDPKGELYQATAGWRTAQGHRSIRLAPLEDPALVDRWNPLAEIERGADDIGVLGLMAEALIVGHGVEDSHWDESARALFRCLALHTLYTQKNPALHHVRHLAHSSNIKETLDTILVAEHDPKLRYGWIDPDTGRSIATHPEAATLARGFQGTPDKEMGSVASTLRRALALWGDPRVVASTATSDFDLGVFNSGEPVTVYCVIPYSDLHRLSPWVRILLAMLVRRITHGREVESHAPLDLYLDEFASLGRVTAIHQILSFLRGYGVRTHIVIQSYDDLERLYGRGENISACQIHVVAATQSRGSRRFISDLAGEATVQWERRSRSGGRAQPLAHRHSRSPTEARRPLITQGEVGTLAPNEILIAKTGMPLIRAKKRFYFQDRTLSRRAAMPVPQRKPREMPITPKEAPPFPESSTRTLSPQAPLASPGKSGEGLPESPTEPPETSDGSDFRDARQPEEREIER